MSTVLDRVAQLSPAKRALLLETLRGRSGVSKPGTHEPAAAMSVADMLARAQLPADIDARRARQPASARPRTVLLTGATGFIGAWLLDTLLRQPDMRVHCLVRCRDAAEGLQRISDNLHSYGLDDHAPKERVLAVPGDLAAPELGIAPPQMSALRHAVEAIYHCGALVKWTYPYSALAAANVRGTIELLRLAVSDRLKPVHFISTVGVFSSSDYHRGQVDEATALEESGGLEVGYAQSKWIAEKLVHLAAARGVPASVYRPNTAPDSGSGAFNLNDYLSQMMRVCIALGTAPDLDIPVAGAAIDYVARAIVHLAQSEPADGRVFHLVNPAEASWRDIVEWMVRSGYAVERVDYGTWIRGLESLSAGFSLGPFFTEGVFQRVRLPRFDTAHVREGLAGTDIVCPPLSRELMGRCLEFLARRDFVVPPPGVGGEMLGVRTGLKST